jgi:serine/threonine protein kinase
MNGGRQPGVPVVPGLANLAVLARGGHATVYRATQVAAYRDVAVKVENGTLDDEKDRRRFLREARAAGRMSSHPHVVDLYDVGVTEGGHPYMIMELCRGNYGERMKVGPLSAAEARLIGVKIADALAGAHAEGVLHRDVKPENILITQFDEPVLADFGLAVLAEAREASVTLELTPAYAAPEMFSGGRAVPASDVYALCATLYALMCGRPPRWQENNSNPSLATLMDLFAERIPDLPGVPAELMAVLRRGMNNDPAQRPSATQLREELRGGHRDPDPTMVMRRLPGQSDGEDPTQPTARVGP